MQNFIIKILKDAAVKSGLNENAFMSKSMRDNITIIKPRVEYSFLQNSIKRTGRLLAIQKVGNKRETKKELYTVAQNVRLKLFSDDEQFRADFTSNFFFYLPKGVNDHNGNYVKFQYQSYQFDDEGDNRIGENVIKVLKTYTAEYNLLATYRVTQITAENYIQNINLLTPEIRTK